MHTLPFILRLVSFSFHSYSRLHAMNIHEDIKLTSNMQKIDVVLCACIKSLNNVVSFLILWYSYLASTSKRRLRLLWHSMSYLMLKGRSFVESFPFATLKRWEKNIYKDFCLRNMSLKFLRDSEMLCERFHQQKRGFLEKHSYVPWYQVKNVKIKTINMAHTLSNKLGLDDDDKEEMSSAKNC